MKGLLTHKLAQLAFLLSLIFLYQHSFAQFPHQELIGGKWKFQKGSHPTAIRKDFDDQSWQEVSIPHDWAIAGPFDPKGDGNTGKLPWKGEGWYRTSFSVNNHYTQQKVLLLFDGVMAFPKVYVNGKLAGKWDYGYNSFYVDVSSFVKEGENLLVVQADTRPHGSRWYPGAGIYRKVSCLTLPAFNFGLWNHFIYTSTLKPHYAEISLESKLIHPPSLDREVDLEFEVYNSKGELILTKKQKLSLRKNTQQTPFEERMVIPNPRKWDIHHPELYKLKVRMETGGAAPYEEEISFGIRKAIFTPDDGFWLNDRRLQIKGVNLHHDFGPLGAAFYEDALRRQLTIMKSMGVNAIRNSHNTAAPELLQLCDEMGLLVVNEVFDKYDDKADIVDTTDFDSFAERNIANFIKRDRNHPSIILWSVGNEIPDVQWNIDRGFARLKKMLFEVERHDPTRPTTLVCDSWESAKLRHFDFYDVHAWNYDRRYRLARQIEPNKSVLISESASTLSTRGYYDFPLPKEKTAIQGKDYVSSYDLNAPYWAEISDDDFMWQQDEAYIAGEFVWTGFDYLGEPTPFFNAWAEENKLGPEATARSSYFGIVDLVGIPKDRYYLYKSYWKPQDTTLHILPHWNWPGKEGENIPVFVYTNGDEAELFLNGVSQGKRSKNPLSQHSVDRFRLMWKDVIYEAGTLKVVAYKEGKLLAEKEIATTGKAKQLRASPEKKVISSSGAELSYILLEAIDKEGRLMPLADHELTISLSGQGEILGVGNGDQRSYASFQSDKVKLFYGKAMVIVRAQEGGSGTINLTFKADGLKSTEAKITLKP
ncbi:MAG: glycoside hydrolase family 2 TIM barrel-domain containing protein [Bacteroidota bacterium]